MLGSRDGSRVLQFGDSLAGYPTLLGVLLSWPQLPGTQHVKVPAASGMVCSGLSIPPEGSVSNCCCRHGAGDAIFSTVLILEVLKFSGLLICLLVVKHISQVYQFICCLSFLLLFLLQY